MVGSVNLALAKGQRAPKSVCGCLENDIANFQGRVQRTSQTRENDAAINVAKNVLIQSPPLDSDGAKIHVFR